jgi:hypothetical protein
MPQDKVETIVGIRHGEKPLLGLGQLTCKGLNRALALSQVLLEKFGRIALSSRRTPTKLPMIRAVNFVRCGH